MSGRINRQPWVDAFNRDFVASTASAVAIGAFTLPITNIFASFRVLVTLFTAGTVQIHLRFGFDESDIGVLANQQGIDFAVLGALGAADFRTVTYDIAAGAPDVKGNPLAILPPRCRIFATTAAATLSVHVYFTCLSVD